MAKSTIQRRTRRKKASRPGGKLTLKDRLSRLTFRQAARLLGPRGEQLIREGAKCDSIDIERDVYLRGDLFRLKFPVFDPDAPEGDPAVVTITQMATARDRLHFNCTACETHCRHIGTAVSLILEEKLALGLAAPPVDELPLEHLSEQQLVERALKERAQRAREERFRLHSHDRRRPWTDYTITSGTSGKSYRVALRGEERGASYCSCPDFRTNTLGTCKHIMYALDRVKKKFPAARRRRRPKRRQTEVHVHHGVELTLHLTLPDGAERELSRLAKGFVDEPIDDVRGLVDCIGRLEQQGYPVTIYPDAEQLIEQRLFQARIADRVAEIRRDPSGHPLRTGLLKTELLPYQLDGIAFAVGAGRAVLADDMGLGKTIQGIGTAELLAREAGIRKVLVVCPASLKSQWRSEVRRFSHHDAQLIAGRADERAAQYDNDCFFTVCNYEQVLRDILSIERVNWDLIILDEGQRIKNWESKTARVIKGLRSPFALVTTGTPLENRLGELYSVVQFVDDRRLAPAFRFFHRHRVVDEKGKVLGYTNLDQLREQLRPILLRRTRQSVLRQLPPRTTEIVRIEPTDEQIELHGTHMRIVSSIVRKAYLTEMDLLRLQKALLMCRMAADGTFLVDKKEPNYSSKLQRLGELFDNLVDEPDRKTVLFSEWTTMLDRIEPLLVERGIDYVRLDGSVPQQKRPELVHRFRDDSECRVFLTTNAGSTGLNLQAANTVINVDLPWNPAVLEQRIARAHRMGQKQPVQVFVLVTEGTLEENLLATLSAKHELALAALDPDSTVTSVEMASGMEELRRRLEVLLGAKPDAPTDESQQKQTRREAERLRAEQAGGAHDGAAGAGAAPDARGVSPTSDPARRERVAAAGGELLGAAFRFLGELVAENSDGRQPAPEMAGWVRDRLAEGVEEGPDGRQRLTLTLPNRESLDQLAGAMAGLLLIGGGQSGSSGDA